jgi:hypothetical protein
MDALGKHAPRMFEDPDKTLLGVVELAHVERTEPAPGSDRDRVVKVKIIHFEVPNRDQEDTIRETLRALYLQRTANGTFDDVTNEIQLSEQTIRSAAGLLHAIEAARYRTGVQHWADYTQQVLHGKLLSALELQHELDTIKRGLRALLAAADTDTYADRE